MTVTDDPQRSSAETPALRALRAALRARPGIVAYSLRGTPMRVWVDDLAACAALPACVDGCPVVCGPVPPPPGGMA